MSESAAGVLEASERAYQASRAALAEFGVTLLLPIRHRRWADGVPRHWPEVEAADARGNTATLTVWHPVGCECAL